MPQTHTGRQQGMRTRRWAPVAVLFITWIFSAIGWECNNGPSIPWGIAGLIVGVAVVAAIHRFRRR